MQWDPNGAARYSAGYYARPLDMSLVMRRVYLWLTLGLVLGFGIAYTIGEAANRVINSSASATPLDYSITLLAINPVVMWGSLIVWFIMGLVLSPVIRRANVAVGTLLYLLYTAIFGVMASVIFVGYSGQAIFSAFAVTAGMFAVLSLLGYTTKVDLSRFGMLLLLALVGLIIASVVSWFWASSTLYWIINYAGVLIFSGLIAYDTQRIKRMAASVSASGATDVETRVALLGAFALFLDFVNLFLFLLRILNGGRRS